MLKKIVVQLRNNDFHIINIKVLILISKKLIEYF